MLQEVTAFNGTVLKVDPSKEACAQFGFEPGDRVEDPYRRSATVVGVAPLSARSGCKAKGTNVLYISVDAFGGKVCFFPNPALDLRKL
jgi:hypothetical protein